MLIVRIHREWLSELQSLIITLATSLEKKDARILNARDIPFS